MKRMKRWWEAKRIAAVKASGPKISKKMKAFCATPEGKKVRSEATRKSWQDPKSRERRVAGLKRSWRDPEVHDQRVKASTKALRKPGVQAKRAKSLKKLIATPEGQKTWSKAAKRCWKDAKIRARRVKAIRAGCKSEESRKRISVAKKKDWKKNRVERLRIAIKANRSPERRRKISIAGKRSWRSSTRKKNKRMSRPNLSELKLYEILKKYFPGIFAFNVLKGKRLGGKTPDFISTIDKVVVELFGDFWHTKKFTGRSPKVDEAYKRSHFRSCGYRCVVVWESELVDVELVVKKVIKGLANV